MIRCLVCDLEVYRDRRAEKMLALDTANEFSVYRCVSCGLRMLHPLPSDDYLKSIYSDEYFEGDDRSYSYAQQLTEINHSFVSRAAHFKKYLPAAGAVLDVGCATGDFLEEIVNVGLVAKGIEFSDYGVSVCHDKGLDVVKGTLEEVSLQSNSFDGVHMSHVLEHMPDPVSAVRRVKDILKPEGYLYIEVPLQFDGWLERLQYFRKGPKDFDVFSIHHCCFFMPESLSRLLLSNGFEVISISTVDFNRRAGRKDYLKRTLLNSFLAVANFLVGAMLSLFGQRHNLLYTVLKCGRDRGANNFVAYI